MTQLWLAVMSTAMVGSVFALLIGRRLSPAIWSPIYGFVATYLILGISGFVYFRFFRGYIGSFYNIGTPRPQLVQALAGFIAAIGAFLIGAMIYLLPSTQFHRLGVAAPSMAPHKEIKHFGIRAQIASIFVLSIPLILTVIGKGPMNVLKSTEYLTDEQHALLIVGMSLSMPAMLALGFITPARKAFAWKSVCILVLLIYHLLFLALSTRRFILAFLFYVLGLALAGARRRVILLLLALWIVTLPLTLQLPLGLRGLPQQGVLVLGENLAVVFSEGMEALYKSGFELIFQNLTMGVELAGFVMDTPPLPIEMLIASVNPLPSFVPVSGILSWESIQDQLRVSQYMPYSALGELLNYGWQWTFVYYVIIGMVAAWIDVNIRRFQNQRSRWGFLLGSGLLFLFSISSTQYNLRSATRFVYYAIVVALVWRFFSRIRLSARRGTLE